MSNSTKTIDYRVAQGIVSLCGTISGWGILVSFMVGMIAHNTQLLPMWLYWVAIVITALVMAVGIFVNVRFNIVPDKE